jgi:tetratricopeptide (TPR) repeat protein
MNEIIRYSLVVMLFGYLLFPQVILADCSDAYSYADDAHSYTKKGYNSDNLDDVHYYAKRATSAAEDAMSAAEDCGCDDAYSYADDTYSYARKAYRSDDFDEAIDYMRKAKSAAEDVMSAADDCGT